MLSRAVLRGLQSPSMRTPPTSLRIASSTVWTRTMARHNRPNNNNNNNNNPNHKKPTEYSRSAGSPQPSKPGGASASFNAQQKSGKPDFSKKQVEVDPSASPARNSLSHSERKGAEKPNPPVKKGEPADFSKKQDEFETASPSENTAPQFTSPSAVNPSKAKAPSQPLPDLTQGIPSTLEFEAASRSKGGRLDLTESEDPLKPGEDGRGKGELPASAYISSSDKARAKAANYMYLTALLAAVGGFVYLGRNWENEEAEKKHTDAPSGWAIGLMWARARARMGDQVSYYSEPAFQKLLPDVDPMFERPYTLVLSLEDMLVHSEWSREHGWRMAKRPGVDYFLRYLSQYYELVIFTSQPMMVADPIIRKLDPFHIVMWPLFREGTKYENGEYVKDLSYLNRDLSKVILLDTVPAHAKNQPENAIILDKWKGNVDDKELVSLIPFLEYIHTMAYSDVRKAIASFDGQHIPTEFSRREALARKKFHAQLAEEKKKRPKLSGLGALGGALGIKSGGMMVMPEGEQSPGEAFAQGKMLQDQARERGLRNYEALEKEIRENGDKWLAEEKAQEEKMKAESMQAMKGGFTSWFGAPPSKPEPGK